MRGLVSVNAGLGANRIRGVSKRVRFMGRLLRKLISKCKSFYGLCIAMNQ